MKRPVAGLRENCAGTTTLELALIFPFMMITFFGCVEVTQLVRAYMGLGVATQAMADLLSHGDPDTAAQVLDACNGAKLVLAPFSSGTFKAGIANVKNTSGALSVTWSNTSCGSATAVSDPTTMATALVPNSGDEATIVQTTYVYTASTSAVMAASYTLNYIAYARPRVPAP